MRNNQSEISRVLPQKILGLFFDRIFSLRQFCSQIADGPGLAPRSTEQRFPSLMVGPCLPPAAQPPCMRTLAVPQGHEPGQAGDLGWHHTGKAHPQPCPSAALGGGKSEPPRRPGACGLLSRHASHQHPRSWKCLPPDQGFSRALSEKKKKKKSKLILKQERKTYASTSRYG